MGHGSSSTGMEVEVREEMSPPDSTTLLASNSSSNSILDGPVVVVRAEEVLLVALVLILWVAAIALFFNRWGKIRMLEPYQPKFQSQNHRPSCPLAPLSPPKQQRMSFSKYNVNCFTDVSALPSPSAGARRPRLNSVFVGSTTMMSFMNPPRRTKSAVDIQHLVISDRQPPPLPHCHVPKRRPSSSAAERPLLSHYQQFRNRRPSCAFDRFDRHHRNFAISDQPRRKPTTSYQGTLVAVDHRPRYSRSFEQPVDRVAPLPRMAASLDANVANSFEHRASILEESVVIAFDEADVTANAPLLERLKSTDV